MYGIGSLAIGGFAYRIFSAPTLVDQVEEKSPTFIETTSFITEVSDLSCTSSTLSSNESDMSDDDRAEDYWD